jgi:hypothetical protein
MMETVVTDPSLDMDGKTLIGHNVLVQGRGEGTVQGYAPPLLSSPGGGEEGGHCVNSRNLLSRARRSPTHRSPGAAPSWPP